MTTTPRQADHDAHAAGTQMPPQPTPGLPPLPVAPSAQDILSRLALLAPLAAGNRGPVPIDDPRRIAAAEYKRLLATAGPPGAVLTASSSLVRGPAAAQMVVKTLQRLSHDDRSSGPGSNGVCPSELHHRPQHVTVVHLGEGVVDTVDADDLGHEGVQR